MQIDLFEGNNREKSISYLDEISESFLDYAMSVITSRALPDIRDGLKPVQRRILFAMKNEGLISSKNFSKCAGIVGEVLKKYHPHGDVAVYETLVRMAQPWVMRYRLVEGQGNFGSIDGDSAAAYRYTEARLDKLSDFLMIDIEKETVDKTDNYNNTAKEPVVLPARFPNLLVNGASGIAVGMATNIPPHNIVEVLDALIAMLKKPSMGIDKIMEHIKGPDFPTGASIIGNSGIIEAYGTGRGVIRLRAKLDVETVKDKKRIVISEIPYGVLKTRITGKIAELVKNRKIEGITDLRDESDKDGVRIVVELRKEAPVDFIIEKLYKNTPMDSNFAVNMVALVDGKPQQVNIRQILDIFIAHRKEVVRRRTAFELRKARERQHVLEGFKKVLDHKLEYLREILPASKDKGDLKSVIEKKYQLTPVQSEAVVVLPNFRFSGLEVDKILEEHSELSKQVQELIDILNSEDAVKAILISEFKEVKSKFPEGRKTEIISGFEDRKLQDLIPSQEVLVSVTGGGFIKRYSFASEQNDRESNVIFTGDDVVKHVSKADMAERILIISGDAKAYPLKVFSIPEMRRYGKGVDVAELLNSREPVPVAGIVDEKKDDNTELLLVTAKGFAKRVNLSELKGAKSNGVSIFKLRKDDNLVFSEELQPGGRIVVLQQKSGIICIDPAAVENSPRGKAPVSISEPVVSMDIMSASENTL
ncbi:MAG: DNA topoisomerase 4 subunit A, partial [Oligoflexia bacterium]|nr:DNA topoisomerase 4 subunit A [Oligoflexia bacterium]